MGVRQLPNSRRLSMTISVIISAMVVLVSVSFAQVEVNFSNHKDLEALFILQDDMIHNYYLEDSVRDFNLNNSTIDITI